MSTPHPPPGPGDTPAATSGQLPPTTGSGAPRSTRRRPPRGLVAVIVGILIVGAGAIVVVAIRSGEDGEAGGRPLPTSAAPASTSSTSTSTTTSTTSTTTPPSAPAPPSTPAVQPSTARPSTSAPPPTLPGDALDLGSGVHLHVPAGWSKVSGPDDPLTISDGTTWYSAQVQQRRAGEGPQPVLQDAVDTFDRDNAAVSYSPATFRGTISGAVPADEYGLVYSAIAHDGTRLSGALQAFVRGDGLAMVVDAWNATDAWPDDSPVPAAITDAIERSLTRAPKLGAAETLPVVPSFRVTSVHPLVSPHGLAGFTVPPGFEAWSPVSDGGVTVAGSTNGITDLVAIAMPAPTSVEEVFETVTADLDERYPDLVIDPPSAQGSRDGALRLGAGFAGTLGGRPIAGGLDVWLVSGDTAFAFAYTYYADIEVDGANPDPDATQFAYSAFADSF